MVQDMIITKTVSVPCVGFGTYKLTGETCRKAVEEALQFGYRHIDTAQFYKNEEEIGKAVRNSGLNRNLYCYVIDFFTDVFIKYKIFYKNVRLY